ncbi:MAG: DUF86 domain-containing protein [Candidatus Thermoplasmatota archaeon]
MKKRDYRDYINDIINSINDTVSFTENMTFSDFVKDRKTINAVIRSIEVIGEATKNIPIYIKDKYPSVPWKKMAGMRDKMIHEYFGIDIEILWKTAKEVIPQLKPLAQKVLRDLYE